MCVFRQGEGALTYAGRMCAPTVYGPHHTGKESLDINLLKAERHSAVPLACDDDAAPEWVTYNYRTSHSILRWLPSKLAEWIGDNMRAELQISAMTQDSGRLGNSIRSWPTTLCQRRRGASENVDYAAVGM